MPLRPPTPLRRLMAVRIFFQQLNKFKLKSFFLQLLQGKPFTPLPLCFENLITFLILHINSWIKIFSLNLIYFFILPLHLKLENKDETKILIVVRVALWKANAAIFFVKCKIHWGDWGFKDELISFFTKKIVTSSFSIGQVEVEGFYKSFTIFIL